MTELHFIEGSRAQALYREGRLTRIMIGGWEPVCWWSIACDNCGADFESRTTVARYCSDECKLAGQRAKGRARVAKHRAAQRAS